MASDALLNVTGPVHARLHVRATDDPEADGLRPARGILLGAVLGGGIWTMIALIVWFIAR